MKYCYFESPVGRLLLTGGNVLEGLDFPGSRTRIQPESDWDFDTNCFARVVSQLEAYFRGELTQFDLELKPGGTQFQKKVWQELVKIPYGETISYGELAGRIGNPNASRAVGSANGKNPISIIIPCHRVIGKNGSLTGFGGGLGVKQTLLDLEKRHKKA
jgi:methylated-DNA-[protein]-cysteine S-methyltransferase